MCSEKTSVFHVAFQGVNVPNSQLDVIMLTIVNSFSMIVESHY